MCRTWAEAYRGLDHHVRLVSGSLLNQFVCLRRANTGGMLTPDAKPVALIYTRRTSRLGYDDHGSNRASNQMEGCKDCASWLVKVPGSSLAAAQ
jgi:hypothetical protein